MPQRYAASRAVAFGRSANGSVPTEVCTMLFENLEARRLFAVTVAVENGVLTVTGDEGDNFVDVHLKRDDDNTLVVRTATAVEEDTTTTTTAAEDTTVGPHLPHALADATTQEFDITADGITSISIDSAGGDDRVRV